MFVNEALWNNYQKTQFRDILRSRQDYKCRPNVFHAYPTPPDTARHINDTFRFHYNNPYYSLYRPSENQWYPYISPKIMSGLWSCGSR